LRQKQVAEEREKQAEIERLKAIRLINRQKETEKCSFAEQLPPTEDYREIERREEAEAKRRQVDIDQLERDLFETPSRKLPIILAGGISLVILILTISGGGFFYSFLSSNSANFANISKNINKPSNISTNTNVAISNINAANIAVSPTVTPITSPTPKPIVEIKSAPTPTPKATSTPTPEIVKPTETVEEPPIVIATPRPMPKPVIVSTPRPTKPKATPKPKSQSQPKSDDCILTRSC
jgi:hypothetical protein